MKFKATIFLTKEQKEAYMPLQYIEFIFTFQELLNTHISDESYDIILIPWLKAGNIPDIIF